MSKKEEKKNPSRRQEATSETVNITIIYFLLKFTARKTVVWLCNHGRLVSYG